MIKPLVGIIGNPSMMDNSYPVQIAAFSNIEAIAQVSHALPVIVPSMPNYVCVEDLCARFDGFLFTGGRLNVHPEEYGEEETKEHGSFDRDRDGLTLPLIRKCVEIGLPILGICRGFQEFNVAFGGSLYPEIRKLPGRMNHRMPPDGTLDEKFALRHDVTLTEGGAFAKIFGKTVVKTNSLHGQGIKHKGERIIIEGFAPDGTPEAIQIADASAFAMAVQWHPEWRADECDVSRPLFEEFGYSLKNK